MKAFICNKEIILDPDSLLWWIDGMIVSYHLTIEDTLKLKQCYESTVKELVKREIADVSQLKFTR